MDILIFIMALAIAYYAHKAYKEVGLIIARNKELAKELHGLIDDFNREAVPVHDTHDKALDYIEIAQSGAKNAKV